MHADALLVRVHAVATQPYGRLRVGFAGVVEAAGEGVTEFEVGDHVCGICDAVFGGYTCVRVADVRPVPAGVDFAAAANGQQQQSSPQPNS